MAVDCLDSAKGSVERLRRGFGFNLWKDAIKPRRAADNPVWDEDQATPRPDGVGLCGECKGRSPAAMGIGLGCKRHGGTSTVPAAYSVPAGGWYVNVHHGPDFTVPANGPSISCGDLAAA
jgi:hypothetical protein